MNTKDRTGKKQVNVFLTIKEKAYLMQLQTKAVLEGKKKPSLEELIKRGELQNYESEQA